MDGTLLSFDGGQLVLKKYDGGVTLLNRSEITNLDFASVPGGLISKPTLVWQLESDKAGKQPLTLTYMTGGMSWHAEYVAQLSDDEKTLDLNGWVSLDNQSGANFENATLKLVAGDVNRVQDNVNDGRMLKAAMGLRFSSSRAPVPGAQLLRLPPLHLAAPGGHPRPAGEASRALQRPATCRSRRSIALTPNARATKSPSRWS